MWSLHLTRLLAFIPVVVSINQCFAADWPQFLGPDRTGVCRDSTPLVDSFPSSGPKVAWKVAGGVGMSGIAVAGDVCITIVHRDEQQTLLALDRATGAERWLAPLAPAYKNDMGDGPRATPTIDDGRVYSFTGEGILHCNKLDDGASLWHRNLVKEYSTKASEYGMSSSPLVADGLVIVQVGADKEAVVAVDATTGKTAWTAGNGRAGYSSPALLNVAGKPQLVAFAGSGCLGIEPKTGNVVWQYPFPTDYDCNTATPIAIDGHVLISSGENHGSVLLKLDGEGKASEVWKSLGTGSALRSEWQTPLLAGKLLFGFDNVGSAGPVTNLACLDATTGKVLWKQMRFGKSNGVFADGKLIISTMDGELVIVRAASDKFDELARAQVIGKTRQAPAIADGFAFLRDDEHIVCVDLRKL